MNHRRSSEMFEISYYKLLHFESTIRQRRPVSKIEAQFRIFDPAKFRGGAGEISQWILRVRPTVKHLVYFWRGVSRSSGRLERGCQKSKGLRQNLLGLMTVVDAALHYTWPIWKVEMDTLSNKYIIIGLSPVIMLTGELTLDGQRTCIMHIGQPRVNCHTCQTVAQYCYRCGQ